MWRLEFDSPWVHKNRTSANAEVLVRAMEKWGRGRENGSFPVAEVLKPLGFKERVNTSDLHRVHISEFPTAFKEVLRASDGSSCRKFYI